MSFTYVLVKWVFCVFVAYIFVYSVSEYRCENFEVDREIEYCHLQPAYTPLSESVAAKLVRSDCAFVDSTPECLCLFSNVTATIKKFNNKASVKRHCKEGSFLSHFKLGKLFQKTKEIKIHFRNEFSQRFDDIAFCQI
ncbi:hypothetical protein L596_018262 [Steinernema carpocapsae]|uniref:Uncharacterized protein n=1 Tax=Steinernema carpocapsae TaxID=34508 RepID=A0A4U5N4K3_STECR|nr:hypothetical protein L596_018262 [Steinernema carpocapsae]